MQRYGQREELKQHAEAFEAELRESAGISLGTTIMAATYGNGLEGGVVLGGDTRTSSGNYVANRATDKITQLSDKIFVCRSGSAADTQNLAAYVQFYLNQHCISLGRDADVKTAAMLTKQMVYSNKEMLQAGLIVAGWDERSGGSVWGVPLGGTLIEQPFTIGGSGSAYIYGFCDDNWRPGMTEAECRNFVVSAVSHAMARDGSSGGNIRTVVINSQGVKRDYLDGTKLLLTCRKAGVQMLFPQSTMVPLHYGELQLASSTVEPVTA